MPAIGSSRSDGKLWAGENYGYQSPASFNALEVQGKFKMGTQFLDRLISSFGNSPIVKRLQKAQQDFDKATAFADPLVEFAKGAEVQSRKLPSAIVAQGASQVIDSGLGAAGLDPRFALLGMLAPGGARGAAAIQARASRLSRANPALATKLNESLKKAAKAGEFRNPSWRDPKPGAGYIPDPKTAGVAGGPIKPGQSSKDAAALIQARQGVNKVGQMSREAKDALLAPAFRGDVWKDASGNAKGIRNPRQNTLDMIAQPGENLTTIAPGGNNAGTGTRGGARSGRQASQVLQDIYNRTKNTKTGRREVVEYIEGRRISPKEWDERLAQQDRTREFYKTPAGSGSESPIIGTGDKARLKTTPEQQRELVRKRELAKEAGVEEAQEILNQLASDQQVGAELLRAENYGLDDGTLIPRPKAQTTGAAGEVYFRTNAAGQRIATRARREKSGPPMQGPRRRTNRRPDLDPYQGSASPRANAGNSDRLPDPENLSYPGASKPFSKSGEIIGTSGKPGEKFTEPTRSPESINQAKELLKARQGLLNKLMQQPGQTSERYQTILERLFNVQDLLQKLK